jgi:hypothetical protein
MTDERRANDDSPQNIAERLLDRVSDAAERVVMRSSRGFRNASSN